MSAGTTINYVTGTTGPPLQVTFVRSGAPVTISAVTAVIERPGFTTLTRAMTVNNSAGGVATLGWIAGDFEVPSPETQSTYLIDFQVTTTSGTEIQPASLAVGVRLALS